MKKIPFAYETHMIGSQVYSNVVNFFFSIKVVWTKVDWDLSDFPH